jgi:O-antigen/teichoic acid export membrane protein
VRARIACLGRRWGTRIGLSVGDQALVSVSNLVLQIVLARGMAPAAYGSFVVGFAFLLFLLGLETALFAEPLSVLGPSHHPHDLLAYLRVTCQLQLLLSAALALVPVAAAVVVHLFLDDRSLEFAFTGLAVATPVYLLFAYLRRACYVVDSPRRALQGSAVYAAILGCGLWIAAGRAAPSPLSGFLVLAAASLAADVYHLVRLRIFTARTDHAPRLDWRATVSENWRYGRWILWASTAHWLGGGLYIPLLGAVAGLSVAGAFRAMQNLVAPIEQTQAALGLLLIPWLTRRLSEPQSPPARSRLVGLWALTVPLALLYGLVLLTVGPRVVTLFYRRAFYEGFTWLLPVFALYALVLSLSHGLAVHLRALERPSAVFWAKVAGAASSLTLGLWLTWKLGASGAAAGLVLSLAAEIAVMAKFFPWKDSID